MRHRKRTAKLGRTSEHRTALLANLVCSLIKHRRIRTTLAKAKAAAAKAKELAEKLKGAKAAARDELGSSFRLTETGFSWPISSQITSPFEQEAIAASKSSGLVRSKTCSSSEPR